MRGGCSPGSSETERWKKKSELESKCGWRRGGGKVKRNGEKRK